MSIKGLFCRYLCFPSSLSVSPRVLNTPNYISRPFSASVYLHNPPHPPVRRLDRTSFINTSSPCVTCPPPLLSRSPLSVSHFFLVCFVCAPLLSSSSFPIRTIGYGTHFPAALLTGTSRHMPLASAEGRERERGALGGWRFWGISFLPSSGARAEVNAEKCREGERGDCVHELVSRWQISIQFVESRIQYLFVKLFFFLQLNRYDWI